MTDQLDIHGNVQPVTWDGQPVYSQETVREGLFDAEAFEQMPGQMTWDDPNGSYSHAESRYKREKDGYIEHCDICHQGIGDDEPAHRTADETAHVSCIRQWFGGNFGREDLA